MRLWNERWAQRPSHSAETFLAAFLLRTALWLPTGGMTSLRSPRPELESHLDTYSTWNVMAITPLEGNKQVKPTSVLEMHCHWVLTNQ